MLSECARQETFRPGDVLAGLMQYIQECYPIRDFPPSDDPAWKELVCRIATDIKLRRFLPGNFNVESVLDDVTILDTATGRIRVNVDDQQGKFLGKRYWREVHRMYEMALETRGLIEF